MAFKKGNKLGKGGPRPNSGRPHDDVKKMFRDMLNRSGAHLRFEQILKEETNREIFLKAYQISMDRAFGKASETKNVTGHITIDKLITGEAGEELLES